MNLREKTLEIARAQLGVREHGANRGPQVDRYLASIGLAPGAPWCAAYVFFCIDQAAKQLGVPNPFVRTGYCPTIANWALRHLILHGRPQPGDVFLYYRGRARHTGFVTAVDGNRFRTIEGNTNLSGSPEGIGVFARERPVSERYRFVRWANLAVGGETPDDRGPDLESGYKLFLGGVERWVLPVSHGRALAPVRRWGQALGFQVGWDDDAQAVTFDGREVDTEISLRDGTAYAPVRDLVEFSGLRLEVDGRVIRVTRN